MSKIKWTRKIAFIFYINIIVLSSSPQGVFPLSTKLRLAAGTLKPIAEIWWLGKLLAEN